MADYFENIIVIGNGFDLNLGLDTSFKSFFVDYVKKTRNENLMYFHKDEFEMKNAFMNFIEDISSKSNFMNDWYNIEKLLGDFCLENSTHDFREEYEKIKENLELFLNDKLKNFNSLNNNTFAGQFFKYFTSESLLKTKIINFNYTHTAETLAKNETPRIPEVTYMHGRLSDIENPIIFGINDKIDVKKNHSFIKKGTHTNHKIIKNIDSLKAAKNIFFFGHSLGQTDHSYFDGFFHYLLDRSYTKALQNIIFFIHDKSIREELSFEINTLTNKNITTLKTQFNLEFVEVTKDPNSFRNACDKIKLITYGQN